MHLPSFKLGAALSVAMLLAATGCHRSSSSSTGTSMTSDDDVTSIFPFDTPFDFKDSVYLRNGLDPAGFAKRLTPDSPQATYGRSLDETRNNTRIIGILGGYDAAGALLYYPTPPAPLLNAAFTNDEQGRHARELADFYRAFLFPKRDLNPLSSAPPDRRQSNIFDTSSGYFVENPLGLWRLTFPRFTDDALFTAAGQAALDVLRERNGTDLDGTPILKRLNELVRLEEQGYLELLQRPDDESQGPPWVV